MDAQKEKEFRFRLRLEQEQAGGASEESPKDSTVLPTLAAGMVGAQGSSLKEEGVLPAVSGALNELTGGAIQNPKSFGLAGPVGANIAGGEDLIGSLIGKQDKDVGLYTPKTLGGNVVSAGAGVAASAGVGSLIEALSKTTGGVKNLFNASKNLEESAYQTTLKARDAFKGWAKDLSARFGADYEKAIGGTKISTENLASVLENTAEEAGILGKEASQLSGAERKFLKYKDSIYDLVGKSDEIPLAEVDKELKNLVGTKFGKQWGQGDHILDLTRKNVGDVIGEAAPEVKVVKSKYAPDLQFKHESFKMLQPYNQSGSFDATSGINFFKRAATGKLPADQAILLGKIKSDYSPGLLDDLMAKGKNAKTAELLGNLLKPVAIGALGTTGAAGAYEGYRLLK